MDKDGQLSELLGKKVFFLHPSATVLNRVIDELVHQEFEIYITKDHAALRRVLRRYPDSIIMADLDGQMAERDMEAWVRGVMNSPDMKNVSIGIISSSDNEALQQKYLVQVKVQCGFIVIKSDIGIVIKKISDALKAANAKGRRKYIRATIEPDTIATINIPRNGEYLSGTVKDISVVGFSCVFTKDPGLNKNALVKDIQIKLQSILLNVEGIVFGSRIDNNTKIYVMLFTQRSGSEVKEKIHKYTQQSLQRKMDMELK